MPKDKVKDARDFQERLERPARRQTPCSCADSDITETACQSSDCCQGGRGELGLGWGSAHHHAEGRAEGTRGGQDKEATWGPGLGNGEGTVPVLRLQRQRGETGRAD